PAHSGSTTENLCATSMFCAAVPARLRGRTFDRRTVISSRRMQGGSSAGCAWQWMHERHLIARPFARADRFAGVTIRRAPNTGFRHYAFYNPVFARVENAPGEPHRSHGASWGREHPFRPWREHLDGGVVQVQPARVWRASRGRGVAREPGVDPMTEGCSAFSI